MDNFKFNFLWRGQLESLNLDKIFFPLFKIITGITMLRGFFGNLIFAIFARMLCGNHLKFQPHYESGLRTVLSLGVQFPSSLVS